MLGLDDEKAVGIITDNKITITISMGKLLGLDDDILVRFMKDSTPHYVLVKKSIINGDFRTQSPFYLQMLEKAYIGLFLEKDFKKTGEGGFGNTVFDAFVGGASDSAFALDITENRIQYLNKFTQVMKFNGLLPKQEILKEIFNNDTKLIENFAKIWPIAKKHKHPDEPLLKIDFSRIIVAAASEIKMNPEDAQALSRHLAEYKMNLQTDATYQPIFAKRLKDLLSDLSASPLQLHSPAKLEQLRPVTISFDAEKIKTKQRASNGEPISAEGLIGRHSFFLSHVGEMMTKTTDGSRTDTVIHLINPWGRRGVTQAYCEQTGDLKLVPSMNNVSIVTIDNLIRWGYYMTYDPFFVVTPTAAAQVSEQAIGYLHWLKEDLRSKLKVDQHATRSLSLFSEKTTDNASKQPPPQSPSPSKS
jgi:hypothetical protein